MIGIRFLVDRRVCLGGCLILQEASKCCAYVLQLVCFWLYNLL